MKTEEKREKLLSFLQKSPFPTVSMKEIMEAKDAQFCVARTADYDLKDNDLWHVEENKSYPREDINCFSCGHNCVMSNGMYEAFKQNPNNPKVVCNKCVLLEIEKHKNG